LVTQVPWSCQTLSGAVSSVLSTRCWRNSARLDCKSGCSSLHSQQQHTAPY